MSRYLLLIVMALLFASRIVHAEGSVTVQFQVKVPDQTDPKQKGKAPRLEATIIGGPNVLVDKLSLSTTNKNQKVTMKADRLKSYTEEVSFCLHL